MFQLPLLQAAGPSSAPSPAQPDEARIRFLDQLPLHIMEPIISMLLRPSAPASTHGTGEFVRWRKINFGVFEVRRIFFNLRQIKCFLQILLFIA